ncbi:MAG: copper resistance protein CopA, partial [Nitrospirota bacterium]
MKSPFQQLNRRRFIRSSAAVGLLAGLQRLVPAYAAESPGLKPKAVGDSDANAIDLLIREEQLQFGNRRGTAITI